MEGVMPYSLVRLKYASEVGVVPTPGNAKEFTHPANRILFPMAINYCIFCLCSHFLWTAENPAAAHFLFSSVRSRICILQCLALVLRLSGGVPWALEGFPLQVFSVFNCTVPGDKSTHFLMRKSQLLSDFLQGRSLFSQFEYFLLVFLNVAVFSQHSKDLL